MGSLSVFKNKVQLILILACHGHTSQRFAILVIDADLLSVLVFIVAVVVFIVFLLFRLVFRCF